MARQLAGCAVKGGVHPQAQIGGLSDQAAQAEVPLPEGQADLGRGGGQGGRGGNRRRRDGILELKTFQELTLNQIK